MCKNKEFFFFKKKTKKTTGYKIKKEIKTESWSGRGLTRVLGMMHHRRVSMLGPAPQKGLQLTGPKEKKSGLLAALLELPLTIIERAHWPLFQPSRDTVKMKSVVAHAPGHVTVACRRRVLVRLAINTAFHNVVTTDCTVLNCDIYLIKCFVRIRGTFKIQNLYLVGHKKRVQNPNHCKVNLPQAQNDTALH